MSTMANQDEWMRTQATIIACKQKWGYQSLADNSVLPEYIVTFAYTVSDRTYRGNYRANSIRVCGQTFEIQYDPKHPSRNSGADVPMRPWIKWSARILGLGAVLLAVWFWVTRATRPVLLLVLAIFAASQYAQAVLPLMQGLQENQKNASAESTQRFSLTIQQIELPAVKKEEMLIQITITNLTDKVLFIRTFRGREADDRVVVEQRSSRIVQRIHTSEGLAPLGREGAATIIQPRSSAKDVIGLKQLYSFE